MKEPRKNHKGPGVSAVFSYNKGQSVIEYVIIFAVVAALSIAIIPRIPGIFSSYVTAATGAMQ